VLDAGLDGDSEAVEEGLVLYHIVGRGEVQATVYVMCFPRGGMKNRLALAPVFITDPSK
jgi:hypothetical protein